VYVGRFVVGDAVVGDLVGTEVEGDAVGPEDVGDVEGVLLGTAEGGCEGAAVGAHVTCVLQQDRLQKL
jgi:hypothetical protein